MHVEVSQALIPTHRYGSYMSLDYGTVRRGEVRRGRVRCGLVWRKGHPLLGMSFSVIRYLIGFADAWRGVDWSG